MKGSNLLATSSTDATIRVWNLKDYSLHIEPIQCLSSFVVIFCVVVRLVLAIVERLELGSELQCVAI